MDPSDARADGIEIFSHNLKHVFYVYAITGYTYAGRPSPVLSGRRPCRELQGADSQAIFSVQNLSRQWSKSWTLPAKSVRPFDMILDDRRCRMNVVTL